MPTVANLGCTQLDMAELEGELRKLVCWCNTCSTVDIQRCSTTTMYPVVLGQHTHQWHAEKKSVELMNSLLIGGSVIWVLSSVCFGMPLTNTMFFQTWDVLFVLFSRFSRFWATSCQTQPLPKTTNQHCCCWSSIVQSKM